MDRFASQTPLPMRAPCMEELKSVSMVLGAQYAATFGTMKMLVLCAVKKDIRDLVRQCIASNCDEVIMPKA